MILARKGKTWLGYGWEERGWTVMFVLGSILATWAIRGLSLRRITAFLGEQQATTGLCVLASADQREKARKMGRVMAAVGRNVPWECRCLAEVLCVKWMLDRYRIPSVSFLGARLDPACAAGLRAHAWLMVERLVVIGGPVHRQYRVTAVLQESRFPPR